MKRYRIVLKEAFGKYDGSSDQYLYYQTARKFTDNPELAAVFESPDAARRCMHNLADDRSYFDRLWVEEMVPIGFSVGELVHGKKSGKDWS